MRATISAKPRKAAISREQGPERTTPHSAGRQLFQMHLHRASRDRASVEVTTLLASSFPYEFWNLTLALVFVRESTDLVTLHPPPLLSLFSGLPRLRGSWLWFCL